MECGWGESCWATAPGWVRLKWKACLEGALEVRGRGKVEIAEPSLGGLLVFYFVFYFAFVSVVGFGIGGMEGS